MWTLPLTTTGPICLPCVACRMAHPVWMWPHDHLGGNCCFATMKFLWDIFNRMPKHHSLWSFFDLICWFCPTRSHGMISDLSWKCPLPLMSKSGKLALFWRGPSPTGNLPRTEADLHRCWDSPMMTQEIIACCLSSSSCFPLSNRSGVGLINIVLWPSLRIHECYKQPVK